LDCGFERRVVSPVIPLPFEAPLKVKHEHNGRPEKATSEQRYRLIIRMHKAGKTQVEIQELCGSCPTTIRKVIKENGLTPKRRGRQYQPISEYRKHTIRRLHAEGKPAKVIARTVGVNQSYVRQVLKG